MSGEETPLCASVKVGPYTVRGVSVGGIYTVLQVPELSTLFDVGLPLRAFCGADRVFLSHGHVDHLGGLLGLLGVRGMMRNKAPLTLFMPEEIAADVQAMLSAGSRMQRFPLEVQSRPMSPGAEAHLENNLWVRAFRTYHPVPSLGYQLFRRAKKLKPEFHGLPGHEIAQRKARGDALFADAEQLELCYATDTLISVLDHNPSMLKSRVLILECTFYDERKSLSASRAGCHIHFDELLAQSDRFDNEHLVLMHTSQIYSPREARRILAERCPPALLERTVLLAPKRGPWP